MTDKRPPAGMRYGESTFDILYLLFDLIAGIIFLSHGPQNSIFYLWGALALVLGGGDAFHLIPRVQMHLFGANEHTEARLGFGMAVTSVTMTVFYLILYMIWKKMFPEVRVPQLMAVLLWISALVRIVICVLPQNNWLHGGNKDLSLMRNLIFGITGVIMIILFLMSGNQNGYGMWKMAIAITLSFAFYYPVVFGAKKKPMLGALMLPKTVMYIWMLSMGLGLISVM